MSVIYQKLIITVEKEKKMSVIYQKLIITVEKEKKMSVIYQKLITILLCHGFEPVPGIRSVE